LRYGLSGNDRPLLFKVDGNTLATVNFTGSASWSTWKTKTITVTLPAGQHYISLDTSGLSGPNIDKLDIAAVNPVITSTTSLYYIHNDHLNTPQVVTNQNQQVVWMGDYEPFGKLAANQTNSIEIFSRFPGQYLDPETNLYYNYFRDYDPNIGRYIESDPIGLGGGINTYGYALQNPLTHYDPDGRLAFLIAVPAFFGGGTATVSGGSLALWGSAGLVGWAASEAIDTDGSDDSSDESSPDVNCPPDNKPPMDCDDAIFACQDELGIEFWARNSGISYQQQLEDCVRRIAPHCL
jgi:RHS repeat-associated protein